MVRPGTVHACRAVRRLRPASSGSHGARADQGVGHRPRILESSAVRIAPGDGARRGVAGSTGRPLRPPHGAGCHPGDRRGVIPRRGAGAQRGAAGAMPVLHRCGVGSEPGQCLYPDGRLHAASAAGQPHHPVVLQYGNRRAGGEFGRGPPSSPDMAGPQRS